MKINDSIATRFSSGIVNMNIALLSMLQMSANLCDICIQNGSQTGYAELF